MLYRNCPSPPIGFVSQKQQRDKYRQRLLTAFEGHYHPDHCIPRFVATDVHLVKYLKCNVVNLRRLFLRAGSGQSVRFKLSVVHLQQLWQTKLNRLNGGTRRVSFKHLI